MKSNSHETLERLIEWYSADVYKVAYCYVKDWQLAEDIMQEVFYKALKGYDGFNYRSSEKTWLIRITVNTCKDYLKTGWLKRVKTFVIDDRLLESYERPVDVMSWEAQADIYECIQKLPSRDREIILLFYYEELSYEEISDVLGIPLGTVRSRLSRARLKLKERLRDDYDVASK